MEIGNIVHDNIEVLLRRLLKSENEINLSRFSDYAMRKTVDYCGKKTFAEVYYKETEIVEPEKLSTKVQDCLANFLHSERFKWITETAISSKEDWVVEPGGYGETRIEGMKAYCKVDFLFPVDRRLYILDWKTGKHDIQKHGQQLVGYSAWASFHFSRDPEEITSIIAYLQPSYEEKEVVVNEFDVEEFATRIKTETEEMYTLCKDVDENIPKEKDTFPKTPHTQICDFCNYRELCA